MLKNGKDYFDVLLERIREIRASDRRAYQKSRMSLNNAVMIMIRTVKQQKHFMPLSRTNCIL